MSYPIETIEGIAKTYGNKLRKCGIKSTKALLERGATPAGRKDVAKETGIDVSAGVNPDGPGPITIA